MKGRTLSLLAAVMLVAVGLGCPGDDVPARPPAVTGPSYPGGPPPENVDSLAASFAEDAMVFVCSPDLAGLIEDVKSSRTMRSYMASAAYGRFKRSRLAIEFYDWLDELAKLMGPDSTLSDLAPLAGEKSAFALYPGDEIKFVYLTEISIGQLTGTALWTAMESAEQGEIGGEPFFTLKGGAEDKRLYVGEFGGLLVAANDEALFRECFASALGNQPATPSLADQKNFRAAFPAGIETGDLTMFIDHAAISKDPSFSRQWMHGRADDNDWIETIVSDLELGPGKWKERRWYGGDYRAAVTQTAPMPECDSFINGGLFGECMAADASQAAESMLSSIARPGLETGEAIKLIDLISPARPAAVMSKSRVVWSDDRLFWRLARTVAVRFDSPRKLNADDLREEFARIWGKGLFLGDDVMLRWEKDEHGISAAPELFPDAAIWIDKSGDYLIASSNGPLHRETVAALAGHSGANRSGGFNGVYRSRWNMDRARGHARAIADALSRDANWPRPENKLAMERDLLGLVVSIGAGEVTREVVVENGVMEETVTAVVSRSY